MKYEIESSSQNGGLWTNDILAIWIETEGRTLKLEIDAEHNPSGEPQWTIEGAEQFVNRLEKIAA